MSNVPSKPSIVDVVRVNKGAHVQRRRRGDLVVNKLLTRYLNVNMLYIAFLDDLPEIQLNTIEYLLLKIMNLCILHNCSLCVASAED